MLFRGQDTRRRVARTVNGERRTVKRHHYVRDGTLVVVLPRNLPDVLPIL